MNNIIYHNIIRKMAKKIEEEKRERQKKSLRKATLARKIATSSGQTDARTGQSNAVGT